jgi:hypothetical protein
MWHDQVYAAVIAAHAMAKDWEAAREIAKRRFPGKSLQTLFPKVARALDS